MTLHDSPRWRGVNHLALVTGDMDATVRFYVGVLGARLVATIGTDAFRHYFFEIGAGTTVAFFEYADVELDAFAKPAGVPNPHAAQFDHLALGLADETALHEMRARLKDAGCEVSTVVDHGFLQSIYFTDPNGIALEASYWVVDPTGHAELSFGDDGVFADPDPVPAVGEIREHGRPDSVPQTRLVHSFGRDAEDWIVAP